MGHAQTLADRYRDAAARILGEALSSSVAYENLGYLCDNIGHRLSGSPQLEQAIDWAVETMRAQGFDEVREEEVMVPVWIRGAERAWLVEPTRQDLNILGLGRSVGTPPEGIEAEVVVVGSFDEVDALGEDGIAGKIVLYDVPYTSYGRTVQFRGKGADHASRYGAVAALVRSVGPMSFDTPHTGAMRYQEEVPRIPAAAVTIENSTMMRRMQERGGPDRLPSPNGGADRTRRAFRQRGGRIPGQRATRRDRTRERSSGFLGRGTGRAGRRGGLPHRLGSRAHPSASRSASASHGARGPLHERGERSRRGQGLSRPPPGVAGPTRGGDRVRFGEWSGARDFASTCGRPRARTTRIRVRSPPARNGSAPWPSSRRSRPFWNRWAPPECVPPVRERTSGRWPSRAVVGLGMDHDISEYFNIHHTPADTFEKIDRGDLNRNVAAMAILAYVLADMPERLLEWSEDLRAPSAR